MKNILSIEWLKIKRYPTFWILAGLFALLMPLLNYLISGSVMKLGGHGKNSMNLLNTAYSFPQVWANMGWWGSLFITFLAILVIIMTTNEYVYRTNRQNVIDGMTKMQFLHAKVLLVIAMSAGATLYFFIVGTIFGRICSGSFTNMSTDIKLVGYFFIQCVDYMGFGLFVAIWIRRSGLAIGLFLLYSMIIESMANAIINHFADKPYGHLLMLQSSDELLPFPIMDMMKNMVGMDNSISLNVLTATALGWCLVYYFICRAILLRKDW